jgi:glutamate-1-semialdehyde 2,1-aminomutase
LLQKRYEDIIASRCKKSLELYERQKRIMASGVSGNARLGMKPYPLYVRKASGSKIIDVDGNEYINYMMGSGVMILGHSHPAVMEAVEKQLRLGTVECTVATEKEIELAEKITKHMPHLEKIRFVNTGTEAMMASIRASRAYTKKDKIAKFEGHFHGFGDETAISGGVASLGAAGPDDAPHPVPDFAGIPKSALETTVVLPFNNADAAVKLIKENSGQLAAVIMEPLAVFDSGAVMAEKDFVKSVREVTQENDIFLIFDEVVTGFRIGGLRGATKYLDVIPDLTTLGKICGGGFPIGVYGGDSSIMEEVLTPTGAPSDKERKMGQSGTFSGNPITMTAGVATISELEKGVVYPHIDELAGLIREGLRNISSEVGIDIQILGLDSIFHTQFASHPIRNKRDALGADSGKLDTFHLGMITRGIFLQPGHPGFTCAMHTKNEIRETLVAAETVLREMKNAEGS